MAPNSHMILGMSRPTKIRMQVKIFRSQQTPMR